MCLNTLLKHSYITIVDDLLSSVVQLATLLMRKIFGIKTGVAVSTQPLTVIMEEQLSSPVVKTAVVTMKGQVKQNLDETDEARVSSPIDDILRGEVPLLIGHPESWTNKIGLDLLRNLQQREMVLLNAVDEMHQGLAEHWSTFR